MTESSNGRQACIPTYKDQLIAISRRFVIAVLATVVFACQGETSRMVYPSPSETLTSGIVLPSLPETIEPDDEYLIYIHGKIMEEEGVGVVSPEFGPYEFEEMLDYFSDAGFTVIGEVRPGPTDVETYADHVVGQVKALLGAGVPSENITVVGFSKGAWITLLVATELTEPGLHFVFLAVCGEEVNDNSNFEAHGRVLSIYEQSDGYGSTCQPLIDRSPEISDFHEIELNTGKRHGAFYTADPAWMDEIISWAGG